MPVLPNGEPSIPEKVLLVGSNQLAFERLLDCVISTVIVVLVGQKVNTNDPSLGHIYKGHYEAGLLWMFLGMPIAVWIGILFGLATAGIGLVFPIVCWVALAWDAYNEKDRRHHHLTETSEADDESPD